MNDLDPQYRPYIQELIPYSACADGSSLSALQLMDLSRTERFARVATAVGHTPLWSVNLTGGVVFKKDEYCNPSGSHYDRAYLPTIEYLENSGLIRPGDELCDITSGSAGISLALMGHLLNYRIRITVPDELPYARVAPMQNLGAEIVRCGPGYIKAASDFQRAEIHELMQQGWRRIKPEDPGMRAVIFERAADPDGQRRICYLNHSENDLTPHAFRSIGEELIEQCRPEVNPAAVVLAMGNWTTIAGISPVIRSAWPDTRIVGYEGEQRNIHDNYGTTVDDIPLRFKDETLLDETVVVTNEERDEMDRRVNSGNPVRDIGHSSLMGLVVAEKIAKDSVDAHFKRNEKCPRLVISLAYDQKYRY